MRNKGFNESCYTYYDDIDNSIDRFDKGLHFNNTSYPWGIPYDVNKVKKYVVAPTLQMSMKWLREVHNIYIDINTNWTFKDDFIVVGYMFNTHSVINSWYQDLVNYPTYEEAVETALKYVLENLI